PDDATEGLYHTADATMWFFHAIDRYVRASGDTDTLERLLPVLRDIVAHHVRGTRFGIGVDPEDGLLRQGEVGYQLTWMDAKVDDWVVTPRRGKAVEINALWYNAQRLLARWERGAGNTEAADQLDAAADRTRASFNERFWYAEGGYLYDVVDGEDGGQVGAAGGRRRASCEERFSYAEGGYPYAVVDGENGDDPALRPSRVLAISLPPPVLDESRWRQVLDVLPRELLTPVGLRSLAPGSPGYAPRYWGDLRARDAAYHQGTVWAWLIGPYIDAFRRVYPERASETRSLLEGLIRHLDDFGVGSIAEIFDAEEPYTGRGCIAQAWS